MCLYRSFLRKLLEALDEPGIEVEGLNYLRSTTRVVDLAHPEALLQVLLVDGNDGK